MMQRVRQKAQSSSISVTFFCTNCVVICLTNAGVAKTITHTVQVEQNLIKPKKGHDEKSKCTLKNKHAACPALQFIKNPAAVQADE